MPTPTTRVVSFHQPDRAPALLKRASYRDAIFWIANNDDTEFLNDKDPSTMSVTAALVVDLFGATKERVRADLIRAVAKARG